MPFKAGAGRRRGQPKKETQVTTVDDPEILCTRQRGHTEDLLDAVEQASGEDEEQAQTARKEAAEKAVQRLAGIGVTLKSHPIPPHY